MSFFTTRSAAVKNGAMISLVLLVASLAMWEWGFRFLGVPSFIVPPASEVVKESVQMWQTNHLLMHTGVTAAEVVAGFGKPTWRRHRLFTGDVTDGRVCAIAVYIGIANSP
jgi:hypothetical protein